MDPDLWEEYLRWTNMSLLSPAGPTVVPPEHRRCFVCGRFGVRPTKYAVDFTCTRPQCAGVAWSYHPWKSARMADKMSEKSRTFAGASGRVFDEPYFDHTQGMQYVA